MIALLAFCGGYYFLPVGGESYPLFAALFSVQFALFLFIVKGAMAHSLSVRIIFAVAVTARLTLLFTDPVLEDDYWRYLWDGRVLANGYNPYAYKPMDSALDSLDVEYREKIGFKEFGTIYPPVSMGVFAFSHLLFADSLVGLKFILCFFDLGTALILLLWLTRFGVAPQWVAMFTLNPLILKEIANSGHLDSIAMFCSVLSAYLFSLGKSNGLEKLTGIGWFILGLAALSKWYALSFAPLYWVLDQRRIRGPVILISTILAFYLPFIGAGEHLLNGSQAFAQFWVFNAGLFKALQWVIRDDYIARVASGALFAGYLMWLSKNIRSIDELPTRLTQLLGALLLLSPVVNAWYVLWILPFAVLSRSLPWLAFSYLVIGSYSWWFSQELAPWVRWTEYLILAALLFFWRFYKHRIPREGILSV
ncbi:MAG: hypothetical protein AB7F86_07455 [Bdellovibrionales bacterium]